MKDRIFKCASDTLAVCRSEAAVAPMRETIIIYALRKGGGKKMKQKISKTQQQKRLGKKNDV